MDEVKDKRFDIVYSAQITYTLTEKDLEFLKAGQSIHVIVADNCSLILSSPKPREKDKV